MRISDWSSDVCSSDLSQFLATMSHELRTPLNAILGFSEIISRELLGKSNVPRYVSYAGDVHDSAQHLLQLITDVLDMSKIEAVRYELQWHYVDLNAEVDYCQTGSASCRQRVCQYVKIAGVA